MPEATTYANASVELWQFPLSGPTGGSGITSVDVIVVRLEDSDGHVGDGFSYVLGGGGAVVRDHAADMLERIVAGQTGIHPAALWRRLAASLNRLGRGVGYLAMAAIDVAAWDLYSKWLGEPLGNALGGVARGMPVYGSGGFGPTQDAAAAAERALEYSKAGCSAIKLRVAGNRADVERINTVAAALPDDVDIMVDANEKCDVPRARWLAAELAEINALWFEEPLPASDVNGYALLARDCAVPIATGEHHQGSVELTPFFNAGSCAIVQPDLAMMGGITECLRVAQLAEHYGMTVSPHFLPALFIHLAAASPAVKWLEDFPLLEPLFVDLPEMNPNGMMSLNEAVPGHGMRWAPGAREEYRVEQKGRRP
ncbi:MAG: mandelate racemase/muconate lactonizing enzyme family protein [Pseudomonadota bacterium]|nr:mandelate racemase/muconate lactonizing enzyme family protein [Pseudomonadota bacterium]